MNFNQTRISVFGGRQISDKIYRKAHKLGCLFAKENYLVYCGGGKGVMEAVSRGVSDSGGICVGILKGFMLDEMNDFIKVPVATNMGISRNALLAYNCDVAVAISGKYGTLSEISYA
nr:TIGR00725 family protein [Candidatus Neomarinimicrobiota bacterium]